MPLRITTWNVNGIRNPFGYQPWRDKRTFDAMFDLLEADIVVMQELKIQRKDLRDDMVLLNGWDCFFSLPKQKKGYSGVGIYTRSSACAPVRAEEGILGVLCPPNSTTPYYDLPSDQHTGGYLSRDQLDSLGVDATALDSEGRCVVLEFPAFVIFGIYSPANSSGTRDDFRYGFLNALDMRVRNLVAAGKRVVVTGDLNVSREEIDSANAEENNRKEGITPEEYISTPNRRIFNQLLEGGAVLEPRDEGREVPVLWDVCRGFHPTRKGMYTHWEQKINARPGNYGSRIDFILCSLEMRSWFRESNIQEGLMGSDHCPVYAVMNDQIDVDGSTKHTRDLMNPSGVFKDSSRLRDISAKDSPSTSAKLLPEFDKRQSIKDMFTKKPSTKPAPWPVVDTTPLPQQASQQLSAALQSSQENGDLGSVNAETTSVQSSQNMAATAAPPSSAKNTDKKRTASESNAPRPLKRTKSNAIPSTSASAPGKGQQSLKGFFKSQNSASSAKEETLAEETPTTDNGESGATGASKQETTKDIPTSEREDPTSSQPVDNAPDPPPPPSQTHPSTLSSQEEDPFVDPVASKQSWSKLFTKPAAPRCEHNEPCISMKTKKSGFNMGREFWLCPRPIGPSGSKERNTQWRCPTFIWSSDWNGSKDGGN
ncbi:MAG: Class II abasic (AP) endonuclease [Alyxoria varia]|nr:MAG: Class II abasic (AP) endonuclease [Alyxoria varia]